MRLPPIAELRHCPRAVDGVLPMVSVENEEKVEVDRWEGTNINALVD
jgi:hypothetical protein